LANLVYLIDEIMAIALQRRKIECSIAALGIGNRTGPLTV
jgi:hypothetical protein